MTQAEATLAHLTEKINQLPDWEAKEVWELVNKLNQVCEHYQSSAQLAVMVVGIQIGIGRGQ